MSTLVATSHKIHVGSLDLTSVTESLDISNLTIAAVSFTNYGSGGFVENKPGLKSGACTIGTFADFADDGPDEVLNAALLAGSTFPISCDPCPSGTSTAGDVAWFSRGWLASQPFGGTVGEAAKSSLSLMYDTVLLRGVVAHPSAARTATGNGTTFALAGPTSTQKLYCALHVFAYSGITSLTVKVQSDAASNMATPTDRLTMTANTAIGSEFKSTTGGWDTETHHRIVYTIAGSGSVTFAAYVAVL